MWLLLKTKTRQGVEQEDGGREARGNERERMMERVPWKRVAEQGEGESEGRSVK